MAKWITMIRRRTSNPDVMAFLLLQSIFFELSDSAILKIGGVYCAKDVVTI
ncbi:hypothetical protein ACOMHN_064452 [Nucella lapillus]